MALLNSIQRGQKFQEWRASQLSVLAKGLSGIRPIIAERICDLLNHKITPVIPSRGSVGASGDLAPLAHMALALIGEGRAEYKASVLPAAVCLERTGLKPLVLLGKEGISLLNGTQAMLSIGCLRLKELEDLFYSAQTAAALSIEALRGAAAAFDPSFTCGPAAPWTGIEREPPHQSFTGGHDSQNTRRGQPHSGCYCLRCIPQVHGAA